MACTRYLSLNSVGAKSDVACYANIFPSFHRMGLETLKIKQYKLSSEDGTHIWWSRLTNCLPCARKGSKLRQVEIRDLLTASASILYGVNHGLTKSVYNYRLHFRCCFSV